MGQSFSLGDNRLGYTYSSYKLRGGLDQPIEIEGPVATEIAAKYRSPPDDLLQYSGCVSFPNTTALAKPPCFVEIFVAYDYSLRRTIKEKLRARRAELESEPLNGPVTAFVFRDFDGNTRLLGGATDGKQWFDRNRGSYRAMRNQLRKVPLKVYLFYPSLTRGGEPASLAQAAVAHQWLQAFTIVPSSSIRDSHLLQCYTYCKDEQNRYFPCGCKWRGECEARAVDNETDPLRRVFFGVYTVNTEHPDVADLFRGAEIKTYAQNTLPMWVELFENCTNNLISMNGDYMLVLGPRGFSIYRRKSPYLGFRQLCRGAEMKKYKQTGCNRGNRMCAKSTSTANRTYKERLDQATDVHFRYHYPKPGRESVYMMLTPRSVAIKDKSENTCWEWDFSSEIPEDALQALPLAMVLEDDGELSIYNAKNVQVGSVTKYLTSGSGLPGKVQRSEASTAQYKGVMLGLLNDGWHSDKRTETATATRMDVTSPEGCRAPPFEFTQ